MKPSEVISQDAEGRRPPPWQALHRRLLPNRSDIGWTPYLWLLYLALPVWGLWTRRSEGIVFPLGCLGLTAFLILYFNGFWHSGRRVLWNVAGLTLLASLWVPFDNTALVFFTYACSFAGAVGAPTDGRRVLLGVIATAVLCGVLTGQPWPWFLLTVCICLMVGAVNIYYAELERRREALQRSEEEVERLATLAERERISRDLHDLLGHTLSSITVKAELARKLSERGDPRASREIADVEQISRQALRQVRQAVEGFRQVGWVGEMTRAGWVCEARGITLQCDAEVDSLDTLQEATLAMVLREAVTNVVRHSKASHCRVQLQTRGDVLVLVVQDDGVGGAVGEEASWSGYGLLGMRERLATLGGTLKLDGGDGWRLEARLPRSGGDKEIESAPSAVEEPEEDSERDSNPLVTAS